MTVSSFNSVSLTPPLVLWSIDKGANNFQAFVDAENYAIHVLGSDQEAISNQFASSGTDKFQGIDTTPGIADLPILSTFAACFQCKAFAAHEAGDHIILIGEVLDFESHEKEPLLFHRGRYAEIA